MYLCLLMVKARRADILMSPFDTCMVEQFVSPLMRTEIVVSIMTLANYQQLENKVRVF